MGYGITSTRLAIGFGYLKSLMQKRMGGEKLQIAVYVYQH